MSIFGFSFTEHSDLAEPYKTFVRQMSKWYNGGEMPELASQDLRFALELQRQKLQSLGLDMQCNLKNTGSATGNIYGASYSDRVFTNSSVNGNMCMTRNIGCNQTQLYKNTANIGLSTIFQSLKNDTQPSASMPLSCPHCGAPSTLGELESGCKYCGTGFLMSELYPKVVNFFISEEYNRDKNAAKNKRELAIFITVSILLTMIYVLFTGLNSSAIEKITGGIVAGGIVGAMLFGAKKLFEVIFFMGKNMRGGGGTGSTLFYANKIKRHDPEFSIEYFRDKITSLFRMAVYSKDATELACCKCQCPEKAADIIEAQLFNFNINSCKIKDNVCDVEVTLFLDCLHYRKGIIQSKTGKYRMCIRKHIKAPTELGFSFSAVSCPSCGGSFDARNVKACPYCGNEYLHEEHDWVITNIK